MKFVIVLAVCVAVAAAANSRASDDETRDSRRSQEETRGSQEGSRQESEESRKRLVTRTEKKRIDRHPDEIALLNGVQQCVLCRETWGEALNSFNNEVNVDGTITADKTCRFACREGAVRKIKDMDKAEKNELLCSACRIGVDFWRAQPSKKTHYQLAKDNMCKAFTHQITREDCEHTVRMYGFDIFTAIRNEVSSSSICHMYNLCGRQTTEFTWAEDAEEDMLEKDLQSVSLDELNPNYSSDKKSKSTETEKSTKKTEDEEENGISVSTERTSSEERERSLKDRRQREREARRERRREERKERHQREREEQERRHAEELRAESTEE